MTASDTTLGGSFRDPSGFLFTRDGELYRQVNQRYRENYDLLKSSGLYDALTSKGFLVAHDEADVAPAEPQVAYKVLRPERIEFISYPYEWSFSQLKAAALLTLDIQKEAMERGMSLQDASAYNVQFRGTKPVMIDTLSFEKIREGQPWAAYGQFCRHFLAPLALMAYRDPGLSAFLRVHIDGVPLDIASELLPRKTRRRPALYMHLHAHARATKRSAEVTKKPTREFSARAFQGLIESLRSAVRKLELSERTSHWSDYYEELDHYTEDALEDKKAFVAEAIDRCAPKTVWDLGANVGVFSRLAGDRGISTVAFDIDHDCVEANYRAGVERGEEHVLPLRCDLTNPSPSLGWAHAERSSLVDRGPADLVLALALIHHLAIANNTPLPMIADFFGQVGRWAVVEFVPKSDPKVQTLLTVREDIFDGYTESAFEEAFRRHFEIVDRRPLRGSERVIYLLRSTR